jgi:MmoB/DmpM family
MAMPPEGTAEGATSAVVGPVLMAGPVTNAIIAVIRDRHPEAVVMDRGSYLRVLVPGRCSFGRASVEAVLRQPFRLPGDLERVMTSFRGRFQVSADEASWSEGTRNGTTGSR